MDLISKIVRLNKIPELLKHKQEEEEEAKNDRRRRDNPKRDKDENREAAHFEIEDRAVINSIPLEELKVKAKPAEPPRTSATKKEGVGDRIDLTI